jgi:hypothetical protein
MFVAQRIHAMTMIIATLRLAPAGSLPQWAQVATPVRRIGPVTARGATFLG